MKIVLPSSKSLHTLYGQATKLSTIKISKWGSHNKPGYCCHFSFTPECLDQSVCSNGYYCQQRDLNSCERHAVAPVTITASTEGTFKQFNRVEFTHCKNHFIFTSKINLIKMQHVIRQLTHSSSVIQKNKK